MAKLRLRLDELAVESFAASVQDIGTGTVEGRQTGTYCTVNNITCNQVNTCVYGETCGGWATCEFTYCNGTCVRCYPGGTGTNDTQPVSCPVMSHCCEG
jgi:hypothetical protein